MSIRRRVVERRLTAVAGRIAELRGRLAVLDEQVGFLAGVEGDVALDAAVGGDHVSAREHRAARSDLERTRRERDEVAGRIAGLRAEQDRLLEGLG